MKGIRSFVSRNKADFAQAVLKDLKNVPVALERVESRKTGPEELKKEIFREVAVGVKGGRTKFPHVTSLVRRQMNEARRGARAGMGAAAAPAPEANIWSALTAVIGGAATIASNALVQKYEDKSREALEKLKLQTGSAPAQVPAQPTAAYPSQTPSWFVPAAAVGGVSILGLAMYMMTRGKRR